MTSPFFARQAPLSSNISDIWLVYKFHPSFRVILITADGGKAAQCRAVFSSTALKNGSGPVLHFCRKRYGNGVVASGIFPRQFCIPSGSVHHSCRMEYFFLLPLFSRLHRSISLFSTLSSPFKLFSDTHQQGFAVWVGNAHEKHFVHKKEALCYFLLVFLLLIY